MIVTNAHSRLPFLSLTREEQEQQNMKLDQHNGGGVPKQLATQTDFFSHDPSNSLCLSLTLWHTRTFPTARSWATTGYFCASAAGNFRTVRPFVRAFFRSFFNYFWRSIFVKKHSESFFVQLFCFDLSSSSSFTIFFSNIFVPRRKFRFDDAQVCATHVQVCRVHNMSRIIANESRCTLAEWSSAKNISKAPSVVHSDHLLSIECE